MDIILGIMLVGGFLIISLLMFLGETPEDRRKRNERMKGYKEGAARMDALRNKYRN
jgi:hypothetical protein